MGRNADKPLYTRSLAIKLIQSSIILLFLLVSFVAMGATFVPISLDHQLRESSGVIRGEYLGSSYKKSANGDVITEASFKLKSMAGLKHHQIINKNNFKIIYPGGKWQGVVYQVTGSPEFKKGEDAILLISKGPLGYMPTNLALGKYSIDREFGKEFISSVVFPSKDNLSQIPYEKFNQKIEDRFGSGLGEVNLDKFVYKGKEETSQLKSKGRKPASISEEEQEENNYGMMGLVALLAFLGFYSAFLSKSNQSDGAKHRE